MTVTLITMEMIKFLSCAGLYGVFVIYRKGNLPSNKKILK